MLLQWLRYPGWKKILNKWFTKSILNGGLKLFPKALIPEFKNRQSLLFNSLWVFDRHTEVLLESVEYNFHWSVKEQEYEYHILYRYFKQYLFTEKYYPSRSWLWELCFYEYWMKQIWQIFKNSHEMWKATGGKLIKLDHLDLQADIDYDDQGRKIDWVKGIKKYKLLVIR